MRELKIELEEVLSLISCAEDYGFSNSILYSSFAYMIGNELSDEEIETYAESIGSSEGYGEEDYLQVKERLEHFRNRYIKK